MNLRVRVCATAMMLTVAGVLVVRGAEPYPAGAKGFAGMIAGKVVSKGEDRLAVEVTKIDRVWKHSKAGSPESLIGRTVTVRLDPSVYADR